MESAVSEIQALIHGDRIEALIVAAVLVAATAAAAAIATHLIRRLMRVDGLPVPESSILVNVARIAIWVVGLSIMLSACFGVDVNALVAALGVGGIALSLGVQDTVKNFIGGLQVTLTGLVHPGDHIVVSGVEGIVSDVSWRQTTIRDYEGSVHIIPNSVINSTAIAKVEPSFLVVTTVVLNTDGRDVDGVLRHMEELAKRAVEPIAELERDPWLLVTQIGEYGVWAKMRFVLKDADHAREARDAALRAIAPYTRNNASELKEFR